jgi:biotin operon repressor
MLLHSALFSMELAMRQTELHLGVEDRELVESYRRGGQHAAREVNRAHILAALDDGLSEAQIMAVLGIGRTAIWRTRAAYREGGVEYAIHDLRRPGRPCRYGTDVEARISALACSNAPGRGSALDARIAWEGGTCSGRCRPDQPRDDSPVAKKNCIKPWRKLMWCVGRLTEEYRTRMYDLLDLYARPLRPSEPVVCVDEKSKQLLGDWRPPLPVRPGMPLRLDYEYVRHGTCNLFVAVEPKGGRRTVRVTDRRAKTDFVAFVQYLLEQVYATARRVHLVLDNLNTHFRKCFEEVLGVKAARKLLRRVVFHYTPKHASWLNMAEIERC